MNFCEKLLVGFESKNTWVALEKRAGFIPTPAIFSIFPFTLLATVANILDTEVEADFTGNPAQYPFVSSCPWETEKTIFDQAFQHDP